MNQEDIETINLNFNRLQEARRDGNEVLEQLFEQRMNNALDEAYTRNIAKTFGELAIEGEAV